MLDDAYWHREPGTSVADHVVSGLVRVALAALLAQAYPRLGPGARGRRPRGRSTHVVAGVVDGFRHVAIDELAGDDVSAIIAGMAGAALIGLGAATLWRSRRMDKRPRRRYLRARWSVRRGAVRALDRSPDRVRDRVQQQGAGTIENADLGRQHVDVSLTTSDELRPASWHAHRATAPR